MASNKPKEQAEVKNETIDRKPADVTEPATEPKETEKSKAPAYVSKYTIKELAEATKTAFSTDKVIVLAALKAAGKETYSMEEATKIVSTFKNKEVSK